MLVLLALFSVSQVTDLGFGAANLPAAAVVVAVGTLAMASVGVLSASFVLAFKRGDPVAALFNLASMIVAGAYFPREVMPEALQTASAWLPHTAILAALRAAVQGGAELTDPALREPLTILLWSTVILVLLAGSILRLAHRYARARGALTSA